MHQPDTYHYTPSLQTPTQIDTLAKQLKPVLGSIYEKVRAQFIDDTTLSKKMLEAYRAWQTCVQCSFDNPQVTFCLQTTCMHFLRIFFVRVCEDYGLISPKLISHDTFKPGAQRLTNLLPRISNSYFQLLNKVYPRARSGRTNSFYQQELNDWFTLDEHTIKTLYSLLKRYNLQGLSVDILGRIYNEGHIEQNDRSQKGQFYSPPHVVDYMLDSLGIPTCRDDDYTKRFGFLEKTVGDLSCGSGSFLVAAAARKRKILQRLVNTHEISPEFALQILTSTFLGFDSNPFACYLAEMNLLMQCLPFLADEQGQLCRSIDHFQINCADILEPTIAGQAVDYLIGNPPYVSAGESSDNLLYRDKVSGSGIYQLLHQRWDLFVPFFERNLQFLRPATGRLGLIVSNGIETEGYAERLRQALSSQYRLLQIDFFPGLRLFEDAAVESTIVLVENRAPDERHEVIRRKHVQADCKHFEILPPVSQLHSNGRIFRWRYDPVLDKSLAEGSIPLCVIVYIGTGVEAQSHEDFDPQIAGKRQKRFTLNDVFLPPSEGTARPAGFTDDGVLGDDIGCYYLRRKRYVAYEKFRPQMRGPRHIALFRTSEKLLLGETSGGYYDRDGLFANHSVQVAVSWKALEQTGAIKERGIQRVFRKSQQISGISDNLSSIAEFFDLRYLLAIINSHLMRVYITSNMHEGTRKGRIYPDVWKHLPIKVASAERQHQIAALVDTIQTQYQHLAALPGMKEQTAHTAIDALLAEIETLIEETYKEPADAEMMAIIMSNGCR